MWILREGSGPLGRTKARPYVDIVIFREIRAIRVHKKGFCERHYSHRHSVIDCSYSSFDIF